MTISSILMIIAALAPAIALCIYVFKKDRVEKEPLWLLILLLLSGVLICFPSAEISGLLGDTLSEFFAQYGTEEYDAVYLSPFMYRVYQFFDNFGAVALVEEGFKWLVLLIITSRSKHFNCVFDGMIYAIFVSLGFAGFENILYVLNNGWPVAILRAFTAVPGHMFNAVIMGYFYSMWHVTNMAKKQENKLVENRIIPRSTQRFKSGHLLVLSLIVPVLTHGFYDYNCSLGSTVSMVVFYIFLAGLYFYCFGKIKKLSKSDMSDKGFASAIVYKKHKKTIDAHNAYLHKDIEDAINGESDFSDSDSIENLLDEAFK